MARRSGKPFDLDQSAALEIAVKRAWAGALDGIDPARLLGAVQTKDANPYIVRALSRAFQDLASGAMRTIVTPKNMVGRIVYTAPTTIDRRYSIEEMVEATQWGPCHPSINSTNFSHDPGRPEVETLPIHLYSTSPLPGEPDTPTILRDLALGGMVPITLDMFLSFGRDYARLRHNNEYLNGLGSYDEVGTVRLYPRYDNHTHPRAIDLVGWRERWYPIDLFGAVKVADLQKNVA